MKQKKIAWFDTKDWEKQYLDGRLDGFDVKFFKKSLTPETVEKVDESFDAVSVFISSRVNKEVIEEMRVDMVACRSTGFDNVDLEKASEEDIKVCNVPHYGARTVAEYTFGLMLTISRKINEAVKKSEEGSFDHQGLKGFDLQEKTLGVIGTGGIGKEVIKIADGFNMDVIAYDPYPDKEAESELAFRYVPKNQLLNESDIVTLHCPLNDQTRHMISEEEFDKMDETTLINTSRGELVDTEDLIRALEKDNVSRAGLDVLEEECIIEDDLEMIDKINDEGHPKKLLEDHIMMERDDVIITPHNAFNSKEALERIEDTTLENLRNNENIVN